MKERFSFKRYCIGSLFKDTEMGQSKIYRRAIPFRDIEKGPFLQIYRRAIPLRDIEKGHSF